MEKQYIRGAAIYATDTFANVNKTGSWRIFKPIVDHALCIGCKICSQFCPDDCVERLPVDKSDPPSMPRIRILMDYCKGCGICAHECPTKAIRMEMEDE